MSKKPVLILPSKIAVALFNEALIPQITQEGGRWHKSNPKGHHEAFADITVRAMKEGETCGFFGSDGELAALAKNNYNFNDSNWINQPATTEQLIAIATKANGGKAVTKKEVTTVLLEIKEIMKKAPKAIAKAVGAASGAAATTVAGETSNPAETMLGAQEEAEETIGDINADQVEEQKLAAG